MKKLLTIDEAARFLNVSKTSLRRWTNAGRLDCVRIGARRERRFRLDDLQRFIGDDEGERASGTEETRAVADETAAVAADVAKAGGPNEPMPALGQAARAGTPRHVSLHFHSRDEHWRLFWPYLRHHLTRRAPALYIYDDSSGRGDADREDIERRLRAEGYDPGQLAEAELLRLLPSSEAYLITGSFSPSRMIDFMESAILRMRAAGHHVGMLSGEMTWFLSQADGVEGMIPYEMRLNDLLARYPDITIVCHYDITRLDSSITLGALCSHPHVQLADALVPGYYGAAAPPVD